MADSEVSLHPLHDRVLIEPIEIERVTRGGLIIPEVAVEKTQRGIVVAVGPGRVVPDGSLVPMSVEPGDEVLYAKYGGSEISITGDERVFIILSERDIHLRLTPARDG